MDYRRSALLVATTLRKRADRRRRGLRRRQCSRWRLLFVHLHIRFGRRSVHGRSGALHHRRLRWGGNLQPHFPDRSLHGASWVRNGNLRDRLVRGDLSGRSRHVLRSGFECVHGRPMRRSRRMRCRRTARLFAVRSLSGPARLCRERPRTQLTPFLQLQLRQRDELTTDEFSATRFKGSLSQP